MREEIRQGRRLSTASPHRASGLLLSLLWVHVMKSPDMPAACRAVRFAVPTVRLILYTSHDANTAELCRRVRGNENLALPLVLTAAAFLLFLATCKTAPRTVDASHVRMPDMLPGF
jgi:hypothetical protein